MQYKILMPLEAKKEYVRTKDERTDKRIYEPNWDFIVIFWILGLRTNQNKTLKSNLEQQFTEAAVYYGDKECFIRSKG